MKFSIRHEFKYTYDSPVRLSTQYLRLTPRDTVRQKVVCWDLETPGQALQTTDGYGNVLHVLTIDKPASEIVVRAVGTVETAPRVDEPSDFTGAPLSPLFFLRPTALTQLGPARAELAGQFRGRASVDSLRELATAIHEKAAQGTAADAAHAFIACCHRLGVPARYISGYLYEAQLGPGGDELVAMHAWAEAWLEDRWRSFDIVHDCPIGEAHIKLAVGADYLDACPVRGVRVGGGVETLDARAQVQAGWQQ
ncbi:MAG: transglutaminase family protein [Betaproteobacteria bacterium]|nr:transglutaminase family protein [Betaproteobacteria bacterium]MBV9360164.1 transglutaminase family protein [Betaproteobacteria bacterium]